MTKLIHRIVIVLWCHQGPSSIQLNAPPKLVHWNIASVSRLGQIFWQSSFFNPPCCPPTKHRKINWQVVLMNKNVSLFIWKIFIFINWDISVAKIHIKPCHAFLKPCLVLNLHAMSAGGEVCILQESIQRQQGGKRINVPFLVFDSLNLSDTRYYVLNLYHKFNCKYWRKIHKGMGTKNKSLSHWDTLQ